MSLVLKVGGSFVLKVGGRWEIGFKNRWEVELAFGIRCICGTLYG